MVGGGLDLTEQVGGDQDRVPSSRIALSRSRSQSMPSGSSPLNGLSNATLPGRPIVAAPMARRCRMPNDSFEMGLVPHPARPTDVNGVRACARFRPSAIATLCRKPPAV